MNTAVMDVVVPKWGLREGPSPTVPLVYISRGPSGYKERDEDCALEEPPLQCEDADKSARSELARRVGGDCNGKTVVHAHF